MPEQKTFPIWCVHPLYLHQQPISPLGAQSEEGDVDLIGCSRCTHSDYSVLSRAANNTRAGYFDAPERINVLSIKLKLQLDFLD